MAKVKRNKVEPRDLVIYHNQFHKINISKLGSLENNLLFDIFKQLSFRDEIDFSLEQLSKMIYASSKIQEYERTQSIVESLHKDFFGLNFKIIYPKRISYIHMFSTMDLNYTDDTHKELVSMSIKVNPDFKYLLQDMSKQFTAFSLLQFKAIRSKYSKTIFRLLSQYSYTGMFRMQYDEFRELLGVPTAYSYREFNCFILKPSIKEISIYIKNIIYKVERERIDGILKHTYIEFRFDKFQNNADYIDKIENKISATNRTLATLKVKRIETKENGEDTSYLDNKIDEISKLQNRNIERLVKCSK